MRAPGEPINARASPHAHGTAASNKSRPASERDTERVQQARAAYWPRIAGRAPPSLKFVDESGVKLAMTRLDGRAPRGERVIGAVPQHDGQKVTMLGALGGHGIQAVMTVEGATDTEVCRPDVRQVLGPTLRPGDLVVLDNLGGHKARGIQQMLARRQTRLL